MPTYDFQTKSVSSLFAPHKDKTIATNSKCNAARAGGPFNSTLTTPPSMHFMALSNANTGGPGGVRRTQGKEGGGFKPSCLPTPPVFCCCWRTRAYRGEVHYYLFQKNINTEKTKTEMSLTPLFNGASLLLPPPIQERGLEPHSLHPPSLLLFFPGHGLSAVPV